MFAFIHLRMFRILYQYQYQRLEFQITVRSFENVMNQIKLQCVHHILPFLYLNLVGLYIAKKTCKLQNNNVYMSRKISARFQIRPTSPVWIFILERSQIKPNQLIDVQNGQIVASSGTSPTIFD